jgi:hypothetical protein
MFDPLTGALYEEVLSFHKIALSFVQLFVGGYYIYCFLDHTRQANEKQASRPFFILLLSLFMVNIAHLFSLVISVTNQPLEDSFSAQVALAELITKELYSFFTILSLIVTINEVYSLRQHPLRFGRLSYLSWLVTMTGHIVVIGTLISLPTLWENKVSMSQKLVISTLLSSIAHPAACLLILSDLSQSIKNETVNTWSSIRSLRIVALNLDLQPRMICFIIELVLASACLLVYLFVDIGECCSESTFEFSFLLQVLFYKVRCLSMVKCLKEFIYGSYCSLFPHNLTHLLDKSVSITQSVIVK